MAFGDRYIMQIAQETQNGLLVGLSGYLKARFRSSGSNEFVEHLAYAVLHEVLGWPKAEDVVPLAFLQQNQVRILQEAKGLKEDSELCQVLSAGAYNVGYGHYVMAGGGRLMNRYLGYMRMQSRTRSKEDIDALWKAETELDRRDPKILRSMKALRELGLWRPRPDNPDEKAYYSTVYAFAQRYK